MRFRFMALFALFGLVAAIGLVALPQRLSAADPLDTRPGAKNDGRSDHIRHRATDRQHR